MLSRKAADTEWLEQQMEHVRDQVADAIDSYLKHGKHNQKAHGRRGGGGGGDVKVHSRSQTEARGKKNGWDVRVKRTISGDHMLEVSRPASDNPRLRRYAVTGRVIKGSMDDALSEASRLIDERSDD